MAEIAQAGRWAAPLAAGGEFIAPAFCARRDLLRGERLHAGHPLFDVAELGAVAAIAGLAGQSGNFPRHRLRPISRIGMVAEELRAARAALLLDLGEEIRHGARIEAGVIHDIGAQQVSFGLGLARVLQEVGAETERESHLRHLRERALAHHSAQNRQRQLRRHLFAGRARAMALHHVRNFVRHHARQFGFVVRGLNGSHIHKDRAAGKSEGIDFFLVHHVKGVRPLLSGSVRRQLLPQALHIDRDRIGIRQDRQLLGNLGRGLLSRLQLPPARKTC